MDNQQGKKKSLKGLIVVIVLLLLIIGAGAAAFATGYLYGGVKSPQETVSVRRVVCTDDIVKEYNRVSTQAAATQADLKRITTERAQAAEKIINLQDMQQDPTCLMVAVNAAIDANKTDQAKQYLEKIKQFRDDGVFVDTSLYGIQTIDALQAQIEILVKYGGSAGGSGPRAGDALPKD